MSIAKGEYCSADHDKAAAMHEAEASKAQSQGRTKDATWHKGQAASHRQEASYKKAADGGASGEETDGDHPTTLRHNQTMME